MGEYRLRMPDVGEGIVEAEIVAWHVKVGDTVEEDQDIVDVMTDKATVEIPAPISGTVIKIEGEAGDMIAVGTEIIIISTEGDVVIEDAPAPAPKEDQKKAPSKAKAEPAPKSATPVATEASPVQRTGRALASPAVRKQALEAEIDLSTVPGTGPAGRITPQDLQDFIASGGRIMVHAGGGSIRTKRTGVKETKIIGLRRKIAENMARSASEIPHITYVEEIDMTALETLRKHLNATRDGGQTKLTLLPFLSLALVKALPDFPHANAHYDSESGVLTEYEAANIGIATATENGLMVAVLHHAEAMDIWQMAAEIKRLSDASRTGTVTREELTGSTITITSLGAIGGVVTTPIINHPETSIIGVNKIMERPVFDEAGRVVPRLFMNLSSSFDHRIVDGFDAASLIQRVRSLMENPATLFM